MIVNILFEQPTIQIFYLDKTDNDLFSLNRNVSFKNESNYVSFIVFPQIVLINRFTKQQSPSNFYLFTVTTI